ncbi:MAG: hypothetical protein JO015_02190 [Verrucomicrobia bacterium]|nr:hypothetical protein [Verrucomicrobiota bacterium]
MRAVPDRISGEAFAGLPDRLQATLQVDTVRSDQGHAEAVREVACLERGPLQPGTLGLSLAEARSILAGLEQNLAALPGVARPPGPAKRRTGHILIGRPRHGP